MTDREIFMALVDGDTILKADAIVLLEGDGFNRYMHAVELYKQGYSPFFVFSGGITDYSYGSFPFQDIEPLILKCGVPKEKLIYENKSLNTKQQADEIMKLCTVRHWNKIILVASHYHQYRAYLTFLKAMFNHELELVIYNSPVRSLQWFANNNAWGSRFSCLKGEFERIEKYTKQGDLVTLQQAIEYQKWKELQ